MEHDLSVRSNFIKATLIYKWKHYVLRCGIDCDCARHRKTWPFVYGMSEWQSVNAAMWDASLERPKLVAAWVFSPSGDETNLLHLSEYADDVFAFHQLAKEDEQFPMDACCAPCDVFSCSSGDDVVKKFRCPALEDMSAKELSEESPFKNEVVNRVNGQRVAKRKFYEEIEGEDENEAGGGDEDGDEDEESEEEEEEEEGAKEKKARGNENEDEDEDDED